MAWLTSDLIADVRRSGMIPDVSAAGFADADILLQASKEQEGRLTPLLLSVREEFYVQSVDIPLVASQAQYRLPKRAVAQRVREVSLVQGTQEYRLTRIEPEQRPQAWGGVSGTGTPGTFKLQGNSIVLYPTPSSTSYSLRVLYYLRPGRLVATSTCKQITTVATDTPIAGQTTFTVSSSTGLTSGLLDFITNASGAECVANNVPIVSTTATTIVVASSYFTPAPSSDMIGDWIAVADTSPIMQLPVELHGLLAQRTVCRILQSAGDLQNLAAAEANADKIEKAALPLIQTRTDGNPSKMSGGPLFRGNNSYLWGGR